MDWTGRVHHVAMLDVGFTLDVTGAPESHVIYCVPQVSFASGSLNTHLNWDRDRAELGTPVFCMQKPEAPQLRVCRAGLGMTFTSLGMATSVADHQALEGRSTVAGCI